MNTRQSLETGVAIGLGLIGAPEIVMPTTRVNVVLEVIACSAAAKLAHNLYRSLHQSTPPLEQLSDIC